MHNATNRFSNRVENYIKYRPSYPPAMLEYFRATMGLRKEHVIADLGSGTGILSELFLRNGNIVYGVEPNEGMRDAAERLLADFPAFHSIDATAENTTLPDHRFDFVTAGQAFHWFDRENSKIECARILKPGGIVALLWNERLETGSQFLVDYEALLQKFGTDYNEINHRNVTAEVLRPFFAPQAMTVAHFENRISQTFEQLKGRLLSSSYVPAEDEPGCAAMLDELRIIFDRTKRGGVVEMVYDTSLYWGLRAEG